MPEIVSDKTVFSLAEVGRSIQKTLAGRYQRLYWIKAEMNKLNYYPHSGHCYPELLEKKDGKIIALMASTLWRADYERISRRFVETTGESLKEGMTLLMQAAIHFDPVHGLSLKILDIDPIFALGELEKEKQASIKRLKDEKLFFLNKERAFPLVPKRLAVISVESSKGYSDFIQLIDRNPWQYKFEHRLFSALLQGDRSVASIRSRLEEIAAMKDHFDVVLIVRGGGAEVGLSSYNHFDLASAIAKFPLPVLTGIGHSTNETVSEMVAHFSGITPSELADHLIQHYHQFSAQIDKAENILINHLPKTLTELHLSLNKLGQQIGLIVQLRIAEEKNMLQENQWQLRNQLSGIVRHHEFDLQQLLTKLQGELRQIWKQELHRLEKMEHTISVLDPAQLLKIGYSLTYYQGKVVKDVHNLPVGAEIRTQLGSGTLISEVTNVEN